MIGSCVHVQRRGFFFVFCCFVKRIWAGKYEHGLYWFQGQWFLSFLQWYDEDEVHGMS